MLNINLLSARFDAERQYRKMRAGELCDYLTMFEDRTVRRRVHQNLRNGKKRHARQEDKIKDQLDRRRGMSAVGSTFLGANGETNFSGKHTKRVCKDVNQQFSRCLYCGAEFDRPSQFAFCGETLTVEGECKRKWNASVRDSVTKSSGPVPDPSHMELTRPQVTRKIGNVAHLKTNFCGACGEYVPHNHEHRK